MTRTFHILCLAALLIAPAVARTQAQQPAAPAGAPSQAPPAPRQAPVITGAPTVAVIVPVTVKNSRGQLVGGLTKDDFRIIADGSIEQKVSYFASEPVPLSAVVLLYNDLPERSVKQVQSSLISIAAGFGPRDEVALVTFDQYSKTISDFSYNNDQLFTQLKRLELGSHPTQVISDPTTAGPFINGKPVPTATGLPPHGTKRGKSTSCLHDALFDAGEMLKNRGRDRRKIIFLISDGSNSNLNKHSFDETLRSLLIADVSVFSISVTRSVPVGKSLVQHSASELDKYAADTGGEPFFANHQPDLERLYSDVTEQARNEYTLAFLPEGVDTTRDYHLIEVRVERPGLTVTARQGYYQSAISVGR